MRAADLYGAKVIGSDGAKLGRVTEIYVEAGEVQAIGVGARNFLERLFGGSRGRRLRWDKVQRLEGGRLFVDHGPF